MKFLLPIAPTTNNLFSNAFRVGRTETPKYHLWKLEAGQVLNAQRSEFKGRGVKLPLTEDVFVCIFLPFISNADLDNRFKATLDLLKTHEIILDDTMRVVVNVQACIDSELERKQMEVLVATRQEMLEGVHTVNIEETVGNA